MDKSLGAWYRTKGKLIEATMGTFLLTERAKGNVLEENTTICSLFI